MERKFSYNTADEAAADFPAVIDCSTCYTTSSIKCSTVGAGTTECEHVLFIMCRVKSSV